MSQTPTVTLRVRLIAVNSPKTAVIEGKEVSYASLLVRYDGLLLKVKCSPTNTSLLDDATNSLDTDVNLLCEVVAGQGMTVGLRAVEIV